MLQLCIMVLYWSLMQIKVYNINFPMKHKECSIGFIGSLSAQKTGNNIL